MGCGPRRPPTHLLGSENERESQQSGEMFGSGDDSLELGALEASDVGRASREVGSASSPKVIPIRARFNGKVDLPVRPILLYFMLSFLHDGPCCHSTLFDTTTARVRWESLL
jgi:hypothetical protein